MVRVLGVDGTHPRGWLGVSLESSRLAACMYRPTLQALLATEPDAAVVAVNLPLSHDDPEGARQGGLRSADLAAREVLGPQAHWLDPAPPPAVLRHDARRDAVAEARAAHWPLPSEAQWLHRDRVLGLHELARADDRLVEAIPEASFVLLAESLGAEPPRLPPGGRSGAHERLVLLHRAGLRPSRIFGGIGAVPGPYVLLDATVAAWTALRVHGGQAVRLGGATAPGAWA